MSITLQFVADSSVIDPVIKWYAHGWATHCDAVVHDNDGAEKLLGARIKGGVAIRPLDYKKFERVERVTLPGSVGQEEFFYNFLMEQIGKPYDETAILGFVFDRDWRAPEHWICSELLAVALEHCGFFGHPLASQASRITPPDLWLAISAVVQIDVR